MKFEHLVPVRPNVRAKVGPTVWRAGTAAQNWGEAPAPQAQCATPLGLSLSEGLGRTSRTPGRPTATETHSNRKPTLAFLLLLGSEVRAQFDAVRAVIAAAAVPGKPLTAERRRHQELEKNAARSDAWLRRETYLL
jgi:hypothetical protein